MNKPKLLVKQNILTIGSILIVLALAYVFIHKSQKTFYADFVKQNLEVEVNNIYNELSNQINYQRVSSNEKRFNERVYISLKKSISEKSFFADGFPFILNKKGDLLIHPKLENKNVSQYSFGARIIESASESGNFVFNSIHEGEDMILYFKYFQPYNVYACYSAPKRNCYISADNFNKQLLIVFMLIFVILSYVIFSFNKGVVRGIVEILTSAKNYAQSKFENVIKSDSYKEINEISYAFDAIKKKYDSTASIAKHISNNDLSFSTEGVDTSDKLISHLLNIKSNIEIAKAEQLLRQQEDERQNWINQGLAKFSDILRQNSENIEKHSDNVIQNLVKYVGANQGGLFLINADDPNNKHLELISAFAYDSKKFIQKQIPFGEGLVGTCAIEKNTIYLSEIPDNYITITSGLGEAAPRFLLVVPIKLENEVLGVVEIASFYELEAHKIEFIEKIMESVASTLASARINAQTSDLLKKFENQSKEMAEKEEEMEQTIEELQSTQEESAIREFEFQSIISAFTKTCYYIAYNTDGQIIDISEPYCELIGFSRTIALTRTLFDGIATEEQKETMHEQWSKILQGNEFNTTINYQSRSKEDIVMNERYIPLKAKNGDISKVIKIAFQDNCV